MATSAHCLYCFESLASSLEKRKQLTLAQVQGLWEEYHKEPIGEGEVEADEGTMTEQEVDDAAAKPILRTAYARLLSESSASRSASSTSSTRSVSSSQTPASSRSISTTSSQSSLKPLARRSQATQVRGIQESPLFVTWSVVSRSGVKRLRGCIGTFDAQELDFGLKSYALTSAFEDSRFAPIDRSELSSLEAGVTLLTDFETASSATAWEIGTHGIRISFIWQDERLGATYLPQIAVEQGWNKEETLISLMRKAGWNGKKSDWQKVNLRVVRYQGKKVALEYEEYATWRKWVDRQVMVKGSLTIKDENEEEI